MKAWDWMHCFKVRIVGFQHKQLKGQRVASKKPFRQIGSLIFQDFFANWCSSCFDISPISGPFPPTWSFVSCLPASGPNGTPAWYRSFKTSSSGQGFRFQRGLGGWWGPPSEPSCVSCQGLDPIAAQYQAWMRDFRWVYHGYTVCTHIYIYSIYVYMNYDIYIWLYVIYYTYSNIFIYKMDTIYNFVMARWIACRKMLDVFQYIAIFQRNIWFLWGFSGCEPPEWFQHPPMSCRLGWHMELMQIVTKTHRRHGRKDR